MPGEHPNGRAPGEQPDPALLWRWAAAAVRPWIGWVFMGIGALLILLGYLGVSREAIVEKQVPYLVSGGIGGVLLCVVGAYFLATEELRRDSGRLDRLEQMVEELHAALLTRPDAPQANGHTVAGTAEVARLVAVEGGETFHRDTCPMADGKEVRPVTAADGLRPCPLCEPLAATTS